jgi:hypothetical protein
LADRSAAALAALVLAGAPLAYLGPLGAPSLGRSYVDGTLGWDWVGRSAVRVAQAVPRRPDAVTIVWGAKPDEYAAQTTQWANVLQRTAGASAGGQNWVAFQPYGGPLAEQAVVAMVAGAGRPVRFVTNDSRLVATIAQIHQDRPDLRVEVVVMDLPRR